MVIGASPHLSPLELWMEKTGRTEARPSTPAMEWGTRLEAVVRHHYETVTGYKVVKPRRMLRHPDHPWMIGHLDGLVVPEAQGDFGIVVEIKVEPWARGYDDEAPIPIPLHHYTQLQHYLKLLGNEASGNLVTLQRGTDFRIYSVQPNVEFQRKLVAAEEEFWQHVIDDDPEGLLDDRASTTEALRRLHRHDDGDDLIANAEQAAWLVEYRDAMRSRQNAESHERWHQNRIMGLMGARARLLSDVGTVSWRTSKPTTVTDWKNVAAAYRHLIGQALEGHVLEGRIFDERHGGSYTLADLDTIEELHSSERAPSRPWRVTWKEDE